ncbi:MAG: glycoside hydrolase family 15 protein [Bdellovibrionales bacterium]|nr:glycoside hydrolase family 15 protein [Bdellovibrionales bacterium]
MQIWGNRWAAGRLFLALFAFGAGSAFAAESSLENWIKAQTDRSLDRVYQAISPRDGAPGSVMASPSRSNPNYYYHWVRDSALVMREVWAYRTLGLRSARNSLMDYALFSEKNQRTNNPSGNAYDYGVGEPKFNMNGSAYNEPWGRPQNDGPALRVLALLGLADDLMMGGQKEFVFKHLYAPEMPAHTVIKADLEFVSHHWQDTSFDLWEEVRGDHFYTRIAQWRALDEGADFAKRMGDPNAASFYKQQARAVMDSLDKFWSSSKNYLLATRNWTGGHDPSEKASQLDISVVLGVLHAGRSGSPFYVDDDRVIATAWELVQAFDYQYAINRDKKNDEGMPMGPGIGRYPEDHYDGQTTNSLGNPWFLATQGMAEYYLRLRGELKARGALNITPLSRPFFEALVRENLSGKRRLPATDPTYVAVLQALQDRSDAFIRRAKFHTGDGGHQSEQFNRVHGQMQGARDLTWSYASFLSLRRIREKNHDFQSPVRRRR